MIFHTNYVKLNDLMLNAYYCMQYSKSYLLYIYYIYLLTDI